MPLPQGSTAVPYGRDAVSDQAAADMSSSGESRGGNIVAVAVALASISSLLFALRLYTRTRVVRIAGADDWTMLLAQILSILVSVATCFEVKYGLGSHAWTVTPEARFEQLKFLYGNIIIYNLAINIVKISFLLQYRRIFQSDLTRRVCLWFVFLVLLWASSQIVMLAMTCTPLEAIIPTAAGHCLPTLTVWHIASAVNIASDLAIFCIPLPCVVRLRLPARQKVLVFMIFCLGFFVCVISIVRILTLRRAVLTSDPEWDNAGVAAWSVIELNSGILVGSLPSLRPLLAHFFPSLGSSYLGPPNNTNAPLAGASSTFGSRGDTLGRQQKEARHTPSTLSLADLAAAHLYHKPGNGVGVPPQPELQESPGSPPVGIGIAVSAEGSAEGWGEETLAQMQGLNGRASPAGAILVTREMNMVVKKLPQD